MTKAHMSIAFMSGKHTSLLALPQKQAHYEMALRAKSMKSFMDQMLS